MLSMLGEKHTAPTWIRRLAFKVVHFFSQAPEPSGSSSIKLTLLKDTEEEEIHEEPQRAVEAEKVEGASAIVPLNSGDFFVKSSMIDPLSDPMDHTPMCATNVLENEINAPDVQLTKGLKVEERWLLLLKKAEDKYGFIVPSILLGQCASTTGFNFLGQLLLEISTANNLNHTTSDVEDMLEAYKDLRQAFELNVP
ncbi:hypothetical protein CFOL_v3_32556 [Cephalotus follicularis]|uniref:Uncharacterized protein n=1 Tax=Cephalotus follicularis TaxID=3775 RepID=A0A1Q3D9H0_CEPFO|nr:hypothetical protein CFOL_v3_32556 [Cephalotus follicularis]